LTLFMTVTLASPTSPSSKLYHDTISWGRERRMASSSSEAIWTPRAMPVLLRGGDGTEGASPLSVSLDEKLIDTIKILELKIELEKQKQVTEKEVQKTIQLKAEKEKEQNPDLICFGQLLDSQLPPMDDLSISVSTMSKAQLRMIPTAVRSWENFEVDLIRHRKDIPAEMLSRNCRNLRRPVGNGGVITVKLEADICSAFPATICNALDQLFDAEMKTTSFSASGLVAVEGLENPDFVTVTRRMAPLVGSSSGTTESMPAGIHPDGATDPGDADKQVTTNSESFNPVTVEPVTVFEIRRENFRMYGSDLVTLYNSRRMVQDAIYQITGYHVAYKCKYGFISCYKYSWATYLDEDGVLYTSPCFVSDTIGELSTLNMMYFVNRKAYDELKSRSQMWTPPMLLKAPPDPPSKKRAPPDENEKTKASQESTASGAAPITKHRKKAHEETKAPQASGAAPKAQELGEAQGSKLNLGHCTKYTFLQVLSNFTDRITWKAVADENCSNYVAVKCYSAEEDRDFEVECYKLMKDLQGSSIPVLLDSRFTVEEEQGRSHGLVISWVGSEHGGSYRMLPTDALQDARRIVVEMHRLGVAHRDIRPMNMNYDFETKKLYMLDFSHAATQDAIGRDAFQQACFEDLFEIDRLIRISKTKFAQEIHYYHWPDCGVQATCQTQQGCLST